MCSDLPRQREFQGPFLSLLQVLVHVNQLETQYDRFTSRVYEKYGTLKIEMIDIIDSLFNP